MTTGRRGRPCRGSGLIGLQDRVEARRGRLAITSPIGEGHLAYRHLDYRRAAHGIIRVIATRPPQLRRRASRPPLSVRSRSAEHVFSHPPPVADTAQRRRSITLNFFDLGTGFRVIDRILRRHSPARSEPSSRAVPDERHRGASDMDVGPTANQREHGIKSPGHCRHFLTLRLAASRTTHLLCARLRRWRRASRTTP